MIDAYARLAKKYPSLTLLTLGVLMFVLLIGLGKNTIVLVKNDLIPNQLWHVLPIIGVLQAVLGLTGIILVGLSAMFAVRRFANKKMADPMSNDRPAQD